jgi:anaerobic magnesium-protoporphyrin IX monomethyl ester cyclase
MKIFLLRPDSEVYNSTPPLGILSLAAYFRQKGPYEVDIFDGRAYLTKIADLVQRVRDGQPDVVGISTFAMERIEGHEAAHEIKKAMPQVTIVSGGAYPTTLVEEVLSNPAIDFAVVGEGEVSGLELLDALRMGQIPESIPGVAWRNKGIIKTPEMRPYIENLDDLPHPAWDLVDLEYYYNNSLKPSTMNMYQKDHRSAPVLASRGCPYRCIYCHSIFGKKMRRHSIKYIVDEIEYLHKERGAREIEIVDDIFNLDIDWTRQFAHEIIRRGLKIHFGFPNGLRADLMTEEIVDLLVQMGAYRITYAVESGSPRVQKSIQKRVDLDKTRKYINYTADKRISVGGFFILGFIDETEEEMQSTIDFACSTKLSTASFFIMTPFPGTEIHQQAVKMGKLSNNVTFWHYYSLTANLSSVPETRLLKLRIAAYARFYLNPLRMIRFLRFTPMPRTWIKTLLIAIQFFIIKPKQPERRDLSEFIEPLDQ